MIIAMPTGRAQASDAPEIQPSLDAKAIELAATQLAVFVGPLAWLLARRAAPGCADMTALYRVLAQELDAPRDREAFLRLQPMAPAPPPSPPPAPQLSPPPASPIASLQLPADVLEQAARDLTLFLGPIAKLLVKRAHAKAENRAQLYHLLANELATQVERDAFLSAAGLGPTSTGAPQA